MKNRSVRENAVDHGFAVVEVENLFGDVFRGGLVVHVAVELDHLDATEDQGLDLSDKLSEEAAGAVLVRGGAGGTHLLQLRVEVVVRGLDQILETKTN